MISRWVTVPCSLLVAALVARLGFDALDMRIHALWFAGATLAFTAMLCRRSIGELLLVVLLTAFAQLNALGVASHLVSQDMMVSVLLSVILLPVLGEMLGIEFDPRRTG